MEYVPDYRLDPPDWEETQVVKRCDKCGEPIFEGDECYLFVGEDLCGDCVRSCRTTA